jgi:MoxR-like ATPase
MIIYYMELNRNQNHLKALEDRISSVIKGKAGEVRLAVATLLARGHLLIEDVPGVGKTMLAFTLARSVDCSFQRVQFTSDMMPSDIIGVSIFNPQSRAFEFKYGPLFANVVLADEINRTNPKTQSALLEAMNERRVSVERKTYDLPEPFMVIATQNPFEYRGTFPLPESQLDRFMMHLKLGYPGGEHEKKAIKEQMDLKDIEKLGPVVTGKEVLKMQEDADLVTVEESLIDYLLAIVNGTRENDKIRLGASTRGAQFLLKAAKANAYCEGRGFIVPEDIKHVAPYVLGHRLILKRQTYISDAVRVIKEILDRVPVPV